MPYFLIKMCKSISFDEMHADDKHNFKRKKDEKSEFTAGNHTIQSEMK